MSIKITALNKYIKIFIVCMFVLLVAVQAGKSYVLDEIDFPVVAHATSQTLKPIYYRGKASPEHVGTYHPTLYINSLAAFIKFFGYNEITVRFFGVVCTLLTAYLLLLILRQLIKPHPPAEWLLLGLFLLNPYTIANTTLPDIDSTILPVVLLLFVYVSLKFLLQKKDTSRRVVLILSALFGLALWSKLTTPLILPPYLAILAIITTKNIGKSLLFALKVTVLGAITFVVTYFIYCKLLGLSPTYTYHFLVDSFTKGTNSEGPLVGMVHNLKNIRTFVYWPTLPVVAVFGMAFIGVLLDKDKTEKGRIKKLLVAAGFLVTIFYIALISPFGGFFKYPFPVFGLAILTIVFFYERYFSKVRLQWWYALTALLLGFVIERVLWKDSMFLNASTFSYIPLVVLFVIVFYVLFKTYARNQIVATLFVLLLCFAIGFQSSLSRVQATAPYPTKYHYGQTGLDETTSYLRANTNPDEAIWSMKDVGFYTYNKYYESYGYYFDKSLQNDLIKMLQDGKVRYYVATTGIGQDNIDYYTDIRTILDTYAVRERQFGNFVVYKVKE